MSPSKKTLDKAREFAESGKVEELPRPRAYKVESYKVTLYADGSFACTCPAGRHGTLCSHVVSIRYT